MIASRCTPWCCPGTTPFCLSIAAEGVKALPFPNVSTWRFGRDHVDPSWTYHAHVVEVEAQTPRKSGSGSLVPINGASPPMRCVTGATVETLETPRPPHAHINGRRADMLRAWRAKPREHRKGSPPYPRWMSLRDP